MPDKLRAIQAARRDGTKFIYEHTDEAIKILSQDLRALAAEDQVAIMVKELVDAKFWTEGRIEMPLIENTMKAMKLRSACWTRTSIRQAIVDTSFLPPDLQK